MKARVGDWLIVESAHVGELRRKALIIEVRHADGSPPYLVRWSDTGEVRLVFPGPDARIERNADADADADVMS